MAMQPFNPSFAGAACPACGCPMGTWGGTFMGMGGGRPQPWGYGYPPGFGVGYGFQPGFGVGYGFQPGFGMGYGMPGYAMGPAGYGYAPAMTGAVPAAATDEQIRDMVHDSLDADPIIPYDADIGVDVHNSVVTLTGTVPNKRIKHAAGDDAWWIPPVVDVENDLEVARARRAGPAEQQPTGQRQTGVTRR